MKILQRYVFKEFLKYFLIMTSTFYFIFIIGDFIEKIGSLKNFLLGRLFMYYIYEFPEIFNDLLPFILFFSILLALGMLGRDSELIVMEISGIDPNKILFPVYLFIFLLSVTTWFNVNTFVPRYKAKAYHIYKVELMGQANYFSELGRKDLGIISKARGNMYLFSDYYNSLKKQMSRPVLIILDDDLRLLKRYDAGSALFQGSGKWIFTKVRIRDFDKDGNIMAYQEVESLPMELAISPELFTTRNVRPPTFTSKELRKVIISIRAMGKEPVKFLVELHERNAYPVFIFIISLFGIPLGFRMRRGNTGSILSYGLIIIAVYISLFRFSYTLGTGGALSPVLSAWAPNLCFFGIYLFLKIRRKMI
ncbi:LptF/LptG family permease [bacterium]|nr:LptF/LptG family permease [bacterium]